MNHALIQDVLTEFVNDVEKSGGVSESDTGIYRPAADPEWTDLGATYIHACQALGRKPKVNAEEEFAGYEFNAAHHTAAGMTLPLPPEENEDEPPHRIHG